MEQSELIVNFFSSFSWALIFILSLMWRSFSSLQIFNIWMCPFSQEGIAMMIPFLVSETSISESLVSKDLWL
jgi:hypothetical protein